MNETDPGAAAAATACSPEALFAGLTHFGGFDWAGAEHQFVVVDPQGRIVLSLRFADDAEGWAQFRQKVAGFARPGVAIETSCGPAVERLLDLGLAVYPMNPKAAERYRDRKAPAGAKSDDLDAWSFADALRTDGHGWRPLLAQDPLTTELRLLCRDEIGLIGQRTALVNQLRAALHEYYPAALDAFDDWVCEAPWRFVIAFGGPAGAGQGRQAQVGEVPPRPQDLPPRDGGQTPGGLRRRDEVRQPQRGRRPGQGPAGRHARQTVVPTPVAVGRVPGADR